MTPPRKTSTAFDRLIAESKQLTQDLTVLRQELQREAANPRFRYRSCAEQRLYLLLTNAEQMVDTLRDAWLASSRSNEDAAERQIDQWKLGNGQLALTKGGR